MRRLRPVLCALVLGACLAGCGPSQTTVAEFCAAHTVVSPAGYWSGAGPGAGLVAQTVSAARWPGQFRAVAGFLCHLRRSEQSGEGVRIDGTSSPAAARREVLVAIRRIGRLPAAH